jgi:hypothetical protein
VAFRFPGASRDGELNQQVIVEYAVNRETAGRYISNSLFVDLVQHGWGGSRTCRSGVITRIINAWLQNDHSLRFQNTFKSAKSY